jgi:hypothetical protein
MLVNPVDAEIIFYFLPEDVKLENEAKMLSIFYMNDMKAPAEDLKFSVEFLRGLLRRIPLESQTMAKIYRELRARVAYDILMQEFGSKSAPRSREEQAMLDGIFQDMDKSMKVEEAKNGGTNEESGEESGKD